MPAVESTWYDRATELPERVLKSVLADFEQYFRRRPDATLHYDTDEQGRFRFRVTAPDDTATAVSD